MSEFFSSFSVRTIWTPELIIVLLLISFIYMLFTGPLRYKFPNAEDAPVPKKRKVYFHLGLLGVYLGFGGPLYILGHMMLSMHMLSMAIVYLATPPLLLIGIPSWFYQWVGQFKVVKKIFTIIGHPLFSILLFNAMFSFYHMPKMFDYMLTNQGFHDIYQLGLLGAAMLMWWHVIPQMKTKYEMTDLRKIFYMFASGLLFTPACALIIFASAPLYGTYTDPEIWAMAMSYCLPRGSEIPYEFFTTGEHSLAFLSPVHDQQFGAAAMIVMKEVVYGAAIGFVFNQWSIRDRKKNKELKLKEYEMI